MPDPIPLQLTHRPRQFPISLTDAAAPPTILAGPETAGAAGELQRRLKQSFNIHCPIVADTAIPFGREPAVHILAIGNMANNAFIRAAYLRYLCLTDRSYPGPGGYEVRTLHAPWGGTRSIVLCGASDDAGAGLAIDRLIALAEKTQGSLGPTIDVKLGGGWESTLSSIDEFETTPRPAEIRFGISDADEMDKAGTYYYLSGRPALGLRYRDAWLRMAEAHPERIPEEQIHLRMCWRVLGWDLCSDTAVFSDADRELVGRYIAEVLEGHEGAANPGLQVRSRYVEPRQNHETHVALLLIYGARYLRRAFTHSNADNLERLGRDLFKVYDRHWKPVEDVYDHGFALTMVDVLDACLCFPDPPFVTSGALRKAVHVAMTGCGNNGMTPILGDADGNWPRELLAAAGSLYRDGRYVWMANRGRPIRQFNFRLERRWADDVAPVEPTDLIGLSVVPLDKLYYDLPSIDPEYAAAFYMSRPNVPHERTFDKLALRSGLDVDDQYILMDGVAGGSHSFDDTNAIHAFDQYGKSWIVPEDNLHWPQQTHHNLLTVVRDGKSQRIPTFAELRHATGFTHSAFVRSAVHDYAGALWQRGLVWRRGDYLLVLDEIEAVEKGNYTIEARYRTLGEHRIAGHTFSTAQGSAEFHISSDGAQDVWGEPVDVSIAYLWDPQLVADRRTRYGGIWPLVLTMLHLSAEHDLCPGDRVTIASALHATRDTSAPLWSVARLGRMGARLQRGDEVEYAGQAPDGTFQSAGIDFTGAAFRIAAGALCLAGATRLSLAGRQILAASDPVEIELDVPSRTALLRLATPAKIELLRGQSLSAAGIPLDNSAPLPAGEHRIGGIRWDALDFVRNLESPPPKTAARSRPRAPKAQAVRIESVEHPTCFVTLAGDRIAVGGATGEIAVVEPESGPLWRASIQGEVLTIAAGALESGRPDSVVAGGTGCAIHAFSHDGRPLWDVHPEFGSQFWIWWTLGESQIHRLLIDDIDGDGAPEVLAGVSNMRLHCYDAEGSERWHFRTDHGIFKTFTTLDIDNDGKKEIIGGNDLLSATSIVRVIGHDGVQRRTFWNQGWTSQVRSLLVEDIDGDGRLEVCCGTNREDCLRVHRADGSDVRWSHNLADTVTGIATLRRGDDRLLIAGSRAFYVSAFDPSTGHTRWVTNVRHAVTSLIAFAGQVVVGTEDARVLVLDWDGSVRSETTLAGPVAQLAVFGRDVLALGRAQGLWRISLDGA